MARRLLAAALLVLFAASMWGRGMAQGGRPLVYVIPIEGTIDLGLAPFLTRTIREAQRAGAAAVLLDINTFGGRVDAAVAMRDTLVNAPVRTIAFINPRAISAGALIALATETIVMADGGTIGAATPVVSGGSEPQVADEKSVSYVRKEFGATAERRGRPPQFAEAMVDADVEITGVVNKGKLLTLTTSEALTHKVANFTADTLDEALAVTGLRDAVVRAASQTWAETFVRFITNPVVSSLLMTIGMLGLLIEIRTPGFALPGTIGLLSLGLFFWGHWIVQLAGWEELLLVATGVVLLAVEIFIIPGFGVAGVGGILALAVGLGLTLVGAGATTSVIIGAFGRVAISILLALAGGLCHGSRSAADWCSTRRWVLSRATRRRPRAIGCSSVALALPCHRFGPPASPTLTGPASTWSRMAATSRRAPPSKSRAWTATASSYGCGHTHGTETVMNELDFGALGAIGLLAAALLVLIFVLYFVPVPLWIAAWSSGAPVGLFTLIGMRLRRVPPSIIVNARISAVKAGLEGVSINDLEAHFLAGGNVVRVVNAPHEEADHPFLEEGRQRVPHVPVGAQREVVGRRSHEALLTRRHGEGRDVAPAPGIHGAQRHHGPAVVHADTVGVRSVDRATAKPPGDTSVMTGSRAGHRFVT